MSHKEVNEVTKYQAESIAKWDYDTDQIMLIEAKNEVSQAALNKFINRNGKAIDVHRTNGRRVFNPFTAMKRSHRKYVTFQDTKLIEVDAKNSHPLLMVNKMISEGLSVEQDVKIAVESGTFYDYLMDGSKSREQVKESWFSFCYDKKINTNHAIYKKLVNLFPKFIESFTKYAEGRSLSEYLQEIESRIWIDKISTALMRARIDHVTIHDSVVFAGVQHLNKVLDVIEASFGSISPPLHVDYLDGAAVEYHRIKNPDNAKYLSADYKLLDELLECKADPWHKVTKPDTAVLMIDGQKEIPMFTLGNFSSISGKSKSGKTLLISAIVAAALSGETVLGKFRGALPDDKRNILYIDTEMADYDFQWVMKRIMSMSGTNKEDEPTITFYRLRDKNTVKRIELIDAAVRSATNLGMVIIDGIRDLVKDINNPEESTNAMDNLMRWTDQNHVHMLTVLHQNPGKESGNKLRGHIGTEAMNKAESVISITKEEGKEYSMVTGDFMRRETFQQFGLQYDVETNLPVVIGEMESEIKRVRDHWDITNDEHAEIISKLFARADRHKKTDFVERCKLLMLARGYDVTRRTVENLYKHWIDENIIEVFRDKNTYYVTLKNEVKTMF